MCPWHGLSCEWFERMRRKFIYLYGGGVWSRVHLCGRLGAAVGVPKRDVQFEWGDCCVRAMRRRQRVRWRCVPARRMCLQLRLLQHVL